MARQPRHALAARVVSRIDQLADITAEPGRISRRYLSTEHRSVRELIARWMREVQLEVEVDALGTLRGRLDGRLRGARTLLIGSSIYTGPSGNRFEGVLGALIAIEALMEMRRLGSEVACAVEIVVLGNDASGRFPQDCLGARAIAGLLEHGIQDVESCDGVPLGDALKEIGAAKTDIETAARRAADLIGYIELQIEQGPVLEKEGAGLGVVTTLGGRTTLSVDILGRAAHNGAWPMQGRRDALAGAAEMVIAAEQVARETASLVASVGNIEVGHACEAVVPGQVQLSIDVRSPLEGARRTGVREMERRFKSIARLRQLTVKVTETLNERSSACDDRLVRLITGAVDSIGGVSIGLPTCTADDALVMSRLCPVGMLCIRTKRGAQTADDTVKMEDIETATRVLIQVLGTIAPNGRTLV